MIYISPHFTKNKILTYVTNYGFFEDYILQLISNESLKYGLDFQELFLYLKYSSSLARL